MPWKVLSIPIADLEGRLNKAELRGFRITSTFADPRAPGNVVVIAWSKAGDTAGNLPNCRRCGRPVKWGGDGVMLDPQTMNEHGCSPAPYADRKR